MNHPIALPALSVGEQPLYLGGRQLSLTPAGRLQPYTWPGLKNWPEPGGQNDAQLAALLQLFPLPRRSPYLAGNKKGPSKEGP